MKATPIFTDNFLSHYISDFRITSIPDIRGISIVIKSLVQELETGKFETLKEEEIKSRFITQFFGDVLGFNYGNSNEWLLREEKKSIIDGKKSDGALGYFYKEGKKDDVRAVIEFKDAKTGIDSKQNRRGEQTPVEQGFSYAPTMGGNCKWVIVSNIKETRFYISNDSSKYQSFFLKDLVNEDKLKSLLFLFHKDNFIKKEGNSQTDRLLEKSKILSEKQDLPIHIIDKLYNCIHKFEGLGFVDPNYISTLFPFNILDEHVWQYHNRNLFTINAELYKLLSEIEIENNELIISQQLKNEIATSNVIDARNKLESTFIFLNQCMIDEISAIKDYKQIEAKNKRTIGFSTRHSFHFKEKEEGITKRIQLFDNKECDCLSCNFRSLNFKKLLEKLKAGLGNEDLNTTEYAFGNYLVASNNYKNAYNILKSIEKTTKGRETKEIEYFLSKLNIKYLHNLISDYQYADGKEILNDIKSIDLDKVIYDEIEFSVDRDVKNYLIGIKEDKLIYKLQDKIEDVVFQIEKLKNLYDNGGVQHAGPNLPFNLSQAYFSLYLHVNKNYIIYDVFNRYKSLTEKVFKGLVISYQTKEVGITEFNEFFLTEAILHINPSDLQEVLKEIDVIKLNKQCVDNLLQKLNNFTLSYFRDGLFNDHYKSSLIEEYLTNYGFRATYRNIFSNLFTILRRLEIDKEQFSSSKKSLLKFLKIETELAWNDLKQFSFFLTDKGYLFVPDELMDILKIAIERDEFYNTKYTDLIETTSIVIGKFYSNYKIENTKLIQTAILKSSSDDGKRANYSHLLHLIKVCNEKCKSILIEMIENELNDNFSGDFYFDLLNKSDYNYNSNGYFQKYCDYINQHKGNGVYKYGTLKLTDGLFIRLVYLIYKFNIDFEIEELKGFTNLNDFEKWLLNPDTFNYDDFDANWLLDCNKPMFLNRLKGNGDIANALDLKLITSFNSELASMKYKYFRR
ncbi:hypothetical protein EO244_11715 [Ancylomarina salipaludis]|uniref:Uncharacterized protein n=1 Tax=Ancylomarina salipaludis TaxID=2501299 RepID=A0A4Q1JJZ2_9BACT|nr:hypothetical protein [Ancylomarina salipaludis]RXQ92209.1 hypothetical protein EO244_11715 [Ancylomarina salipaludis]